MIKSKAHLTELIDSKKINLVENNIQNEYFDRNDDVIVFWAGNRTLPYDFISTIWGIESASNENFVHIFSLKSNEEINNFITQYISYKNSINIKFTIIDDSLLNFLPPIKRAGLYFENIFANFTFWALNNLPYKNIYLSHNDVIFYRKVERKDFDFNLGALIGAIFVGKDSDNKKRVFEFTEKLPKKFNLNKKDILDYQNRHFHTGFLFMDEFSLKKFKLFYQNNFKKIVRCYKYSKFPEQEFLKIFQIKNKEIKYCDYREANIEEKMFCDFENALFLHMDHRLKPSLFSFENFYVENYNFQNLTEKSISEIILVQKEILKFLLS